jgi:hypothetical protein
MCLDSPKMKKCEVRHHNGEKILDLTQHWGKDRGRIIWTNYEVYSFQYSELLDVVCTAENDLTYTYSVSNTPNDWWDWGGCGPGGDYGGAHCVNDQNEKTVHILTAGSGEGTVTRSPLGINCGSDDNGEFCYHSADSQVTLTAHPEPGIIFSGWSTEKCPGSAPCVITVDESLKITATFVKNGGSSARNLLLLAPDEDELEDNNADK